MPLDTGRIYEGMRRVTFPTMKGVHTLRLWIRLPESYLGSDAAIAILGTVQIQATEIVKVMIEDTHLSLIVQKIADEVEGVNAVELIDGLGNGFLAYNDWP